MIVLALNPGSSSLRFRLFRAGSTAARTPESLAGARIESIGPGAKACVGSGGGGTATEAVRARDHAQAVDLACSWLSCLPEDENLAARLPDAVGVRVVHGGPNRFASELASEDLLAELSALDEIAPLHNRAAVDVIARVRSTLGASVPVVAVFDAGFHADLPPAARTLPLARDLAARHGLRRIGFHGLAVASVIEQHAGSSPGAEPDRRVVVAHLGSGCSVTAVRDGRSMDCSMGFSPLEGLVMATRSGDVDPALVGWLSRVEGVSPGEVTRWLCQRSGLLGISGRTGDMREIEHLRAEGDPAAGLAFDLFVRAARKHVAGAIATLGGADALIFSGGIGENSVAIRRAVCSGMEWCGIRLDRRRNEALIGRPGTISAAGSAVGVHVVRADEERVIARETVSCLIGSQAASPAWQPVEEATARRAAPDRAGSA